MEANNTDRQDRYHACTGLYAPGAKVPDAKPVGTHIQYRAAAYHSWCNFERSDENHRACASTLAVLRANCEQMLKELNDIADHTTSMPKCSATEVAIHKLESVIRGST